MEQMLDILDVFLFLQKHMSHLPSSNNSDSLIPHIFQYDMILKILLDSLPIYRSDEFFSDKIHIPDKIIVCCVIIYVWCYGRYNNIIGFRCFCLWSCRFLYDSWCFSRHSSGTGNTSSHKELMICHFVHHTCIRIISDRTHHI